MNSKPLITLEIFTLMLLRGLGPGRPPPSLRLFSLHRYTVKNKLSHQMTVKILYLISSCKYFLRIPTKTTFISTESWKLHQLIRGHVVFLFSFDTYDVVRSWSIFLLPSIVLDNLFDWKQVFIRSEYCSTHYAPMWMKSLKIWNKGLHERMNELQE